MNSTQAQVEGREAAIRDIPVTPSSGNVFEDLGVPEPAEALLKADLARRIAEVIHERGLTQSAAARVLGVDQPKVSALLRGRLTGFTIDRLVRYATALDQHVEVVIRPKSPASEYPLPAVVPPVEEPVLA